MKKRGFFTGELTVAIVVALLLLLASVYKAGEAIEESRIAEASAQAGQIAAAVSQYKLEIGAYPARLSDLTGKKQNFGPWLPELKNDPWGEAFEYQTNADGYVVYSKGPNKKSDGSSLKKIANGDIGYIGR